MFLLLFNSSGGHFTYYIDTVNGNDSNSGRKPHRPWKTTTVANSLSLSGTQSVGYKYSGTYVLYRKEGMLMSDWVLPMNIPDFLMNSI